MRFQRQRHVHGHLVTVEVGVEGHADKRVQLDGLAFDEHRLKGLNAEAVQRGRAVEQHGVFADDFFQNVPHHRVLLFHHALGLFHRGGVAEHFQLVEDEGFEKLQRHQFGQAALVQFELRADHDDRTPRIIDALAQQVLTETTALAFNHVGKRFERTLVGTRHGLAATAIVQQGIDGFLQHAFFVAQDDFRRFQLEEAFQTVVAVDDAAIEVVQIRGGETTAIERHQRTQIRRQHGQHFQNHPFGLDARGAEGFQHFQALGEFLDLGFRTRGAEFAAQFFDFGFQVNAGKQRADAFGAHQGVKVVAIFFNLGVVIVFGEQLTTVERRHARLNDDEGFKVEHALDVAQRHVQHHAQTAGQGFEEPDVRHRAGQFDVPHALAAHFGLRDFHAAFFADYATVFEALVFAADAFVVFHRAENLGAEKAVALRLEGAVVDGLRLSDFAIRPATDFVRRGQADSNGIKFAPNGNILLQHAGERKIFHEVTPGAGNGMRAASAAARVVGSDRKMTVSCVQGRCRWQANESL